LARSPEVRVLLTGGAGFIGSHVAERLLDRSLEVIAVDDLSSGKRENVPEGARFSEEDVRSGCEKVFQELRPEVLCHQVAHIDVRRSMLEPDFDADVNVLGTVRLLQNCVRYRVGQVVFASSGGPSYGEQNEFPASEDHSQCPVSPYGVSKLAGERYLHSYHVQYGVSYAALRYANVYGPRQDPHGEAGGVAIFSKNLTAQRVSTINGRGEQTRDYTYVGDVARANVLALEGDPPSGAYNVGTAVETTVNELYKLLQDLSGEDLPARHGPAKSGEQLRSSIDPARASRVFGWRPQVQLAAGLEETLRFVEAH
jgi:UDP-glucose 4-epimerase